MSEPSGKFVVRIPPSLHKVVRRYALRQHISLNECCVRALESYVDSTTPEPRAFAAPERTWVAVARDVLENGLICVLVFGSTARGEAREESDVDLLIVADRSVALKRRLYETWDFKSADHRASPHFVHLPAEIGEAGSLWFEAALDGIILYETGRSVSRFLSSIRRAIVDGLIERKEAHGHGYWVKRVPENANVQ